MAKKKTTSQKEEEPEINIVDRRSALLEEDEVDQISNPDERLPSFVEKLKKERSNQARFRGELQEVKNMVDKIYKELDSENESNVFTTELINEINNFFPELADMQPQISRQTSDSQEAHSISYAFGIKRVLQEEKLFIAQSEEEDELFFPINKEKLRSRLKKK